MWATWSFNRVSVWSNQKTKFASTGRSAIEQGFFLSPFISSHASWYTPLPSQVHLSVLSSLTLVQMTVSFTRTQTGQHPTKTVRPSWIWMVNPKVHTPSYCYSDRHHLWTPPWKDSIIPNSFVLFPWSLWLFLVSVQQSVLWLVVLSLLPHLPYECGINLLLGAPLPSMGKQWRNTSENRWWQGGYSHHLPRWGQVSSLFKRRMALSTPASSIKLSTGPLL